MGGNNILSWIEKLKGRENYSTWAMENYFEHEGLQKCLDGSERDAEKLSKAKTTLNLSIGKENYVHVLKAKTAKDVWDKLKKTFEDNDMAYWPDAKDCWYQVGELQINGTLRERDNFNSSYAERDWVCNAGRMGRDILVNWID